MDTILGTRWLGSSFAETEVKVMTDGNLNTSWQDALAASSILGCISRSTANRSREKFIHFYSATMRQCLDYHALVWRTPQYREDIDQ